MFTGSDIEEHVGYLTYGDMVWVKGKEPQDDDNKWPRKTIDGVEYLINPLDESVLLDPKDGNAIGCLKEDGTIEPLDDDDDFPTKTFV